MVYLRKRIGKRRTFFQKHKVPVLVLIGIAVCLLSFLLAKSLRNPGLILFYMKMPLPSYFCSNHFSADDDLNAPVLLPAGRCAVVRHRHGFAESGGRNAVRR